MVVSVGLRVGRIEASLGWEGLRAFKVGLFLA